MPKNSALTAARVGQHDEFYTCIDEIYSELCTFQDGHFVPNSIYASGFKNKIVLCNCNDISSNFYNFFHHMFVPFGLKKLITVSYGEHAYIIEETKYNTIHIPLEGDGNFLSYEGLQLIKDADIICTNPPFSALSKFIQTMMALDKSFLILGDLNVLGRKTIFSYFKDGKLWLGKSIHSGDRPFYIPDRYMLNAKTCGLDENAARFIKVKGVRWFTNIGKPQYPRPLQLIKSYVWNDQLYPRFLNYDGINIKATKEIPYDFFGKMGVPLTFVDKFNPDQFKLCGLDVELSDDHRTLRIMENEKEKNLYARWIIQRKLEENQ